MAALCACDPVARDIGHIVEGGERAEQAKISLNLAKGTAVSALVAAFGDRDHPVRARIDLAEALYRIYLREKNAAAYAGLVAGLDEPAAEIRAAVARFIGDIGEDQAIGDLLSTLEAEQDPGVQLEILRTFAFMGRKTIDGNNPTIDLDKMMDGDKVARFTRAVAAIDARGDSLAAAREEWLENIAETLAAQARKNVLRGDLDAAEQGLLDALALVPESHNINFQLGKFYYQNGRRDAGLARVGRVGLTAYAAPLARAPAVDGDLDDPAWAQVEPLTRFYQLLIRMGAYPAQGRSEVYIGHRDQALYIGVKGYEPRTDNLRAERDQRDAGVWRDDCVEIYLDANHDARTYHQFDINSLGAFDDIAHQMVDGFPNTDFAWNAEGIEAAARVAETFWSMEFKLPFADISTDRVEPGDIWGFNIAQVRIANGSESAQWAPTYGWSQQPDRFGFLVFK